MQLEYLTLMAESGGQPSVVPPSRPRVRSADKTKTRVTAVGENVKEKQVFCLIYSIITQVILFSSFF